MRAWKYSVVVVLLFLGVGSCTSTTAITNDMDYIIDRCSLTDADLYMVDATEWFNEYQGVGWRWLFPCSGLSESLASRRSENGDQWDFLGNPAREGPLPPQESVRAFGVWVANSEVNRTLVADLESNRLGYVANNAHYWNVERGGTFATLSNDYTADLEALVVNAVSEWTPISVWPNDPARDTNVPGLIPMEGWIWEVTLCMDDYSLYRFEGRDAIPEGFQEFIDAVWSYV